jgi:gliding motility-associated-like protein
MQKSPVFSGLPLLLVLLLATLHTTAQTDTLFWFAAPEVSISTATFDRPIVVRLTTGAQAATVTISQPAGGGMPPQVVNVAANSTQTVDLSAWIDVIENKPADVVLNYGLKIQSTTPVTAYYEVVSQQCQCNPEIFVLKGQSAMGNDFWIPSQNYLDNNPGYSPVPYSSFDIVATEDNTTITITPSNNIVGHIAGTPFAITLNQGQTYSATAASGLAAQHLQGSRVTTDKPIAITIKDDLLLGAPFGGCSDLGGDQIVPIGLLGTEYVAMKGFLNAPGDQLFVTAIQNGTTISQDGVAVTTINAGQTYRLGIAGSATYIQTSAPVYVLQLSGFGCEIGIDIIPPIICTGSFDVSFTRSTSEDMFINVMVRNGGQNGFLVNGSNAVITGGAFTAVPGTGGQWLSAQVSLPVGSYPQGTAIRVSNSTALFHLGLIHGGPGSGTRFGYFSNFARIDVNAQANAGNVCVGSGIQLTADTIPLATYAWNGPGGFSSAQQNPFVPSASVNNSGNYIVQATVLGCVSPPDTIFVAVTSCFPDTDNDGITDEYDIDDDNDGITDAVECGGNSLQNLLVNSGFEQPVIAGSNVGYYTNSQVPGWETTSSDSTIEMWANNFNGVPAFTGTQHAEINYTQFSALYQDVPTTPGDILVWYCAHRGRAGTDVMEVRIGDPSGTLVPQGQYATGNTAWAVYNGTYIVPTGQTTSRFAFQAISSAGGSAGLGNFLDEVTFYNVNCNTDTDGDGVPNSIDLDSDNDGIYDLVEAGHGLPDADNNGRIDGANAQFGANGLYSTIETNDNITGDINYTVRNTDNTGAYDFISLNSDGDTCYDVIEAGYTQIDADGLLGNGTATVDANGLVTGAGAGYTTPASAGGSGFDFQNAAYNACECHIVYTTTVDTGVCQGVVYTLPDNSTTTTGGTYVDTLVTAEGCDSVVTTNLTIYPLGTATVDDTICQGDSYSLPDGLVVTATGTYTSTLQTIHYCDSTITTNLFVRATQQVDVYDTICTGVTYTLPGGGAANATGTYTDTLTTIYGCDSVVRTQLYVRVNDTTVVADTICNGTSYTLQDGSSVTTAGSYPVTLTNRYGCDSIIVTNLSVITVAVTATATEVRCYGQSNGSIAAAVSGGVVPYTFTLLNGGAGVDSNTTGNFAALAAGNYTVDVYDAYGCTATSTAIVNEPAELLVADTVKDVRCFGEGNGQAAIAAGSGVPPYTYSLSGVGNNNTGVFSGLSAANYTYTVTDGNNCTDTGSLVVTEPQAVELTVIPLTATINLGDTLQLNATSNYDPATTYTWSPANGLSCTDCASPVVTSYNNMEYTVQVTADVNGNNCIATQPVTVTVIPRYDLFIPNTFTPNNDGNNDVFKIFGNLQALKYLNVQIFNRIGEKVYESNELNFSWDGTYQGKPHPAGVLVYTLKVVFVDNHTEELYTGSLTLMR